jgi:hypothetical protein
MLRIVEILDGRVPDLTSMRDYQRTQLGRLDGSTRLTALMPVPARSVNEQPYDGWTDAPEFVSRPVYDGVCRKHRRQQIGRQLTLTRPRAVVVFGWANRADAEHLAGQLGIQLSPDRRGFLCGTAERTRFVACKHPNTHGLMNDYFDAVGHWLAPQ